MRCKPKPNLARRAGRPHAGLTLVELLVAISVMAIVAVMGWRGLDTIVRARVSLTSDLDQTRGLQLTFAQLQNDCNQIASPALLQNRQVLRIDDGRLALVRTVQLEGQPLRVQVISYVVRDGVLVRQELPATRDLLEIDAQMRSIASGTPSGYAVSLYDGVGSIALRLWADDNRGWRNAAAQEASDSATVGSGKGQVIAQTTGTPLMVQTWTGLEMTLRLAGRDAPMQKIFLLGAV
ncbi:MAG: prepilin-type N-terminal cleavage/methylation protein [Paucimonas sp.]|nr:prepilin-type N-terminal cleavage/methylation protein [Paucimonas sp.]